MLLQDIAEYLESKGIAALETDMFIGGLPDQPDSCVALFRYAGSPPQRIAEGLEYPGLQVKVRDKSYEACEQKMLQIERTLHCLVNKQLSSAFYLHIFANQSPEPLGRDQNNRMEFVQNFAVTKTK